MIGKVHHSLARAKRGPQGGGGLRPSDAVGKCSQPF